MHAPDPGRMWCHEQEEPLGQARIAHIARPIFNGLLNPRPLNIHMWHNMASVYLIPKGGWEKEAVETEKGINKWPCASWTQKLFTC
jgi:hypothetical protein